MKRSIKIFILYIILSNCNFSNPLLASENYLLRPSKLVVSPNDSICKGSTVQLELQFPVGNLLWNSGATSDTIFVTPSSTSTYYVINDFGGSSQDTFFVTITVFPDIKPIVNITPSGIVCKGDSVLLILTNPINNILWSTNGTSSSISFLADTVTDFYVINDAGGRCPDTTSLYVQIKTKNYTLIDIHGGSCPGSEVNINIINPKGTIIWNTGSSLPYLNINPDSTTTYTLINNASASCADTLSIEIFVHTKIKPKITVFPKDSICSGDKLQLRILNPYNNIYWSNGSSDSIQFVQAVQTTPLWVINDYNGVCPDTTILNVNVINIDSDVSVPNCFTPNGDGINDVFKISDIVKSDYTITVFNRWGQKIFESGDKGARDWNGDFNGNKADEGNYFWILQFRNYCGGHERIKRGFVTLMR